MIIFNFDDETHNSNGTLKVRPVYWIGGTEVVGEDEEHQDEIYEQLDSELAFL